MVETDFLRAPFRINGNPYCRLCLARSVDSDLNDRKIAILVPSRERPKRASELIESWKSTSAGLSEFYWYVDDDDPAIDDYSSIIPPNGLVVGPRLDLCAATNQLWRNIPKHDFYMYLSDDFLFRTKDWDARVLEAFNGWPDRVGIVYCNDLYQKEKLATEATLSGRLVDALGYVCPPAFQHLYVDNFVVDLGRALGRLKYLENVLIEHMHPDAGKARKDEGYKRVNSRRMFKRDKGAYEEMRSQLPSLVERLKTELNLRT